MPTLFRIQVNFLFNEILIDHYEFHSNPLFELSNRVRHKFYLIYSRSIQMVLQKTNRFYNRTDIENNHPYSVHFDMYGLYNNQSDPQILGSWRYPIYFDFLPSFRLAKILRFPVWLGNSTADPCENHTCNPNSRCRPIFNQNNSYFCSCIQGFYGKGCLKYDDICNKYCSPNAICRLNDRSMITNTIKPFCICPFGYFGPRCYLKFEQCYSNPCLNNGTCVYTYELYVNEPFYCNCSKFFSGNRCQHAKIVIQIQLNTGTISQTPRGSTIQFYDVNLKTLELIIRHQQSTQGLPSLIYYAHDDIIAPTLSILKTHYESIQSNYFLVYLQSNTTSTNISSSPTHCPLASSLLERGKNDSHMIPDVFKYHHICRNKTDHLCFYDNNYICICQNNHYRADCFMHDINIDHCSKCLSNGKCIKNAIDDENDFVCLCPSCHQGHQCEFNMQAFGFTLDSLLAEFSRGIKVIYVTLSFLLFTIGFFNNLCSFVTFKRPTPRKVGVGNYLLMITCLNQISLICLLVKFIQIASGIMNVESCKAISYLFSVFTRLTYWLTSCVTLDRLFLIFFPTSTALKTPQLAITIIMITSLCLFVMHIHEIIYYTTIQHLSSGLSICVTNFDTDFVSIYDRVSTLIHYILPFFIQIISITLLIVLVARSRIKTVGDKMTLQQVLIKQFHTQKELYITPVIIILSALPQTILSFSLACSQLTIWHRHLLLIAYLLSYVPQALGFILYVLPSTSYKREFTQTVLVKRSLSWLFDKKRAMTVSKTK